MLGGGRGGPGAMGGGLSMAEVTAWEEMGCCGVGGGLQGG